MNSFSRLIVYVCEDFPYVRLTDLENNSEAMIWLDIKMKHGKDLRIRHVYREFKK